MNKIAFIGAGSMAEALIQGWTLKNIISPSAITISNRSNSERLLELSNEYGISVLEKLEDLKQMDVIILAMKPKDAYTAMENIAPYVQKNAVIFSVLAGIPIQAIENYFGNRPIIRAMPNTSATIGLSSTGIAFNALVTPSTKQFFIQLLEAVGVVMEVEEEQLHAITALSGSGPAYIYYLLEAFEKVGAEYGLSNEVVRTLMVQTIVGSAEMLKQGKEEPSILRQKVTSPGGTTEAAIKTFEQFALQEALFEGIRSAEKRSRELAKGQ